MARYEVLAPVPGFTGVVDGIHFIDSRAWLATADTDQTIQRFRDNGYTVVDRDAPVEPEPAAESPESPESTDDTASGTEPPAPRGRKAAQSSRLPD